MMRTACLLLAIVVTANVPCISLAAVGDDQYAVAASHYSAGRWQLAVDEFLVLIQDYPQHSSAGEAEFFVGESLVQLGRYAKAEPHFERFLEKNADHLQARRALFRLGEAAYFRGDLERSRSRLEEFLEGGRDDELAAYALPYLAGVVLTEAQRDTDQTPALAARAQELYAETQQRFPDGPLATQTHFGLARAQHLQGDVAAAAAGYQQLADAAEGPLVQQARYFLGTIRYDASNFKDAAELLAGVIVAAPDSQWARASYGPLAICHARQEQWNLAAELLEAWQRAVEQDSSRDVVLAHVAEMAFAGKQWEWAGQFFAQLAMSKKEALKARGLSGTAWVQYESGQLDQAVATFGRLAEEHDKDPLAAEAAFMRAAVVEEMDKPGDALAAYHEFIESYSDSADRPSAMFRAAALHEAAGQSEDAAALYSELVRKYGGQWKKTDVALYRWAWLLTDLDRPEEAAERFSTLNEDHRESQYWADATYRLAERATEQRDDAEAKRLIADLLASSPPPEIVAHTYYLQARAAQSAGDWSEVEKSFGRLLVETPESRLRTTAEFWLAEAAYQQGEHDEARKQFSRLEARLDQSDAPWRPTVLLRRAQLLGLDEKWPDSLEIVRTIESDFPEFEQRGELYYLKGRALMADAKFSDAREAFIEAAPRDGSSKTETAAMAQWMIGETYMHQESYEEALREYLRVEALYAYPQWQAAALLQAAKCSELLSRPADAVRFHQQIVKQYPNTQFVEEATQRLGEAGHREN